MRDKLLPGWIITYLLTLIPLAIWAITIPPWVRVGSLATLFTVLGQVAGLAGMSLFAVSLILSARLAIFEDLFGGMNRVYIAHHIIGAIGFMLLLLHPLFLATFYLFTIPKRAALLLLPGSDWPTNFGIAALVLFISLMLLTMYIKLPYHIWRWTHKWMGVAFFLGGLHSLFVSSDVSQTPLLKNFYLALCTIALLTYHFRTILGRFLVHRYTYIVDTVSTPAPNIVQIDLLPTPGTHPMPYRPGQFIFLGFDQKKFSEVHPFSISSSPNEPQLTISSKSLGDYTSQLSTLTPGTLAHIEGPFGRFTYTLRRNKQQVWIAGGIGMTPFLSMAKSLKTEDGYVIDMYYCVKDQSEAVYHDDLTTIATRNPNFHYHLFSSATSGHISADRISKDLNLVDRDVFVCGPPPMMNSLRTQCNQLGLPHYRIHTEEFSLS